MEEYDSETQQLMDTVAAQLARPIERSHPVATDGSTTERGGKVINASSGSVVDGKRVALVGDTVQYPDGSEARIVSGAGCAFVYRGRSIALVGSELDNGDRINGPAHGGATIVEYEGADPIPGLFDRNYIPA